MDRRGRRDSEDVHDIVVLAVNYTRWQSRIYTRRTDFWNTCPHTIRLTCLISNSTSRDNQGRENRSEPSKNSLDICLSQKMYRSHHFVLYCGGRHSLCEMRALLPSNLGHVVRDHKRRACVLRPGCPTLQKGKSVMNNWPSGVLSRMTVPRMVRRASGSNNRHLFPLATKSKAYMQSPLGNNDNNMFSYCDLSGQHCLLKLLSLGQVT